jgi:uncharacterized protein involved in exopolysaccharide biosynthesis
VQQAIYSLIEDNLKQITIAQSTDEYAFKVVERAYLPERKVFPKRFQFLFGGAVMGILSVLGYLFISSLRERSNRVLKKSAMF